jgi:membrane protein
VRAALDTGRRVLHRIGELGALERGLALSSKLFVALIPTTILATSVLPHRSSFADSLVLRLGLTGAGAQAVRDLFASPGQVRGAMSALGVLILGYAILSMARALQRVYEDAWRLPRLRAGGTARALAWMATAGVYFAAISPLRAALAAADSALLRIYVPIVLGSVVWAATPHVLLARRVPARRLLPTGVITAVALTAFWVASRVYMPAIMTTDAHRYGLIGATFGLVSWLYAASTVLIVCAAAGAVLAERGEGAVASAVAGGEGGARTPAPTSVPARR